MRVVVRIRGKETKLREDGRPNRALAAMGSSAAWPSALVCFLLCAWRWAFDLGWASAFAISEGVFSHWQVWFVTGALCQMLGVSLRRYAEPAEDTRSDAVAGAELLRKELP